MEEIKKKTKKTSKSLAETVKNSDPKPITKKVSKNEVIKVKYLKDNYSPIPKYAHDGDIGMDVIVTDVKYDSYHDCFIYHTNFRCEAERGVGAFLMPRSSNYKSEAYLCNGIGLIDVYQYRGEWLFCYKNRDSIETIIATEALTSWNTMPWYEKLFKSYSNHRSKVSKEIFNNIYAYAPYNIGDKAGQIVFMKFPEVGLIPTDQLSDTERGEGGLGSTGR